jgi:hypothetical protein
VVLAVAAAGLTAVQSGPAHAATATGLPITSVYQVLADTAHDHVFISQGELPELRVWPGRRQDCLLGHPAKPGECVRFQVQQGSHSVWDAGPTTGCVALNKWSQTMLTRKLGPTGWFRVRADFTSSAKDTTNVSTDGGWGYYVVTK